MIIEFPVRNENLDELIKALDIAFDALASVSSQLDLLEQKAKNLQDIYDREVQALAHRLGGLENVPVEYLLYTSLDTEILEVMEKLQWKETT